MQQPVVEALGRPVRKVLATRCRRRITPCSTAGRWTASLLVARVPGVDEDRRRHLELLQGVINRMSNNSFLLKSWSIVLVSGLFALAAKDANPRFAMIAYLPAIAFWGLDGYFLCQERRFRGLYDQLRQSQETTDYSMNTGAVHDTSCTWWSAVRSLTLSVFHGAILLTIIVVMASLLCR